MILGRTKSGTMRLSLDAHGLRYEIDVPDTQVGRDLVTSMKRGDIDGSSFAFACKKDAWENDEASGTMLRTVLKADLFDCSPVVYPAYPDASSAVRSMFPDGVPEVPKPETREKDCRCECASCLTGDCEDCDPDTCTDEDCRCHGLADSDRNRLAIQIELRMRGVKVEPRAAHGDTQRVDGEDLTKDCFAYRPGDVPSKWKLPIKFSTDEKTKTHIRDAVSRWSNTEMPDADEKAKARERIKAAAKKYDINLSDDDLK
jgi:hypothetical protein